MEHYNSLRICLMNYTNNQRETISEMAASDLMLVDIWKEQVVSCIRDDEWSPEWLLRSLAERVGEILNDLNSLPGDSCNDSLEVI